MNATHCEKQNPPAPHGLAADEAADVTIGDTTGTASAPHRDLTTERLFGEAVLRDYESFLLKRRHLEAAHRASQAREMLLAGATILEHAAGLDELLVGVHFLLLLPRRTTETVAFTYLAEREGRTIAASCASTEMARLMGFFDGPHFSMSCRIVSSADGVPRDLSVGGNGTWANYGFSGELRTSPAESAVFRSQNVSVMGMGAVRGFDLRAPDSQQLAAVSFWQVPRQDGTTEPRAWLGGASSPGWSDALLATLGIAYLYPWPSACDDQHLREEGMKRVPPALR